MKKFLLLIPLAFVIFIFFVLKDDKQNTEPVDPSKITIIPQDRSNSYELGLGYVTANRSIPTDEAWGKISEVAHVAYIQRTWDEWLHDKTITTDDIATARGKGLKIYLGFELLNGDRSKLALPEGVTGDFATKQVQDAYLTEITRIAKEYKPEYFIVNVEPNLYKPHNEKDYANYVAFYPQVYKAVKAVSPQTQIGVSSVYNNDTKDWFGQAVKDFDKDSDILPVSIYPFDFGSVANIPQSFLFDLASFSSHPLFVAETSWPSSFDKYTNADQAAYVDKMVENADYAVENGKTISVINFVSLIDPDKNVCKILKITQPFFYWFCSLAVVDGEGREKPAFFKLKEWKKSLDK